MEIQRKVIITPDDIIAFLSHNRLKVDKILSVSPEPKFNISYTDYNIAVVFTEPESSRLDITKVRPTESNNF